MPCVKKLLTELGGDMNIQSEQGEGTQFKIQIPNV
ncbi:hypothetical protein [Pedobacter sp.]